MTPFDYEYEYRFTKYEYDVTLCQNQMVVTGEEKGEDTGNDKRTVEANPKRPIS